MVCTCWELGCNSQFLEIVCIRPVTKLLTLDFVSGTSQWHFPLRWWSHNELPRGYWHLRWSRWSSSSSSWASLVGCCSCFQKLSIHVLTRILKSCSHLFTVLDCSSTQQMDTNGSMLEFEKMSQPPKRSTFNPSTFSPSSKRRRF